jgi:sec-independent protein translocase protein TatA
MFGSLGAPEIAIIAVVLILLFGVGKLSGLGKDLGTSVREFRRAVKDPDKEKEKEREEEQVKRAETQAPPPPQAYTPPATPPQQPQYAPPPPTQQGDNQGKNIF